MNPKKKPVQAGYPASGSPCILLKEFFITDEDGMGESVPVSLEEPGGEKTVYFLPVFWLKFPVPFGNYKILTFCLEIGNVRIWTESVDPDIPEIWQQFCILGNPAILRSGWFVASVQPHDRMPQSCHRPLFLINTTKNPVESVKIPKEA